MSIYDDTKTDLTDKEFATRLLDNSYCSAFLFMDDEGNEYTFDGFDMCMFGSFHNIIKVKKITNERDKWFPNIETEIEMLKEKITGIEKLTEEYPIKHPEKYAEKPTLYTDYLSSLKSELKYLEKHKNDKDNN